MLILEFFLKQSNWKLIKCSCLSLECLRWFALPVFACNAIECIRFIFLFSSHAEWANLIDGLFFFVRVIECCVTIKPCMYDSIGFTDTLLACHCCTSCHYHYPFLVKRPAKYRFIAQLLLINPFTWHIYLLEGINWMFVWKNNTSAVNINMFIDNFFSNSNKRANWSIDAHFMAPFR